jgi:amino acid transporter
MYSSFSDFIIKALKKALPEIRHSRNIPDDVIKIVCALLIRGWWVFAAVCAILALGAVAFVIAIGAFFGTGAGIIAAAVFVAAGYGAYRGIKYLYEYRWFPLAVWAVGKLVKPEYDNHASDDSYISALFARTVKMIIERCK